jgi:hypothetical protein
MPGVFLGLVADGKQRASYFRFEAEEPVVSADRENGEGIRAMPNACPA